MNSRPYLEGVLKPVRVDLGEGCLESVSDQLLYLREKISDEVKVKVGLLGLHNLGKVLKTEFVAIFKFSVVIGLLLNRVVRQVHERVTHIVERELPAACADVPVLITVAFNGPVDARHEAEAAEVKLASVHKQRIVNVLLDDESAIAVFLARTSNYLLDFSQGFYDLDALATIGVLARLDNPGVLRCSELSLDLLDGFLVITVRLAPILVEVG